MAGGGEGSPNHFDIIRADGTHEVHGKVTGAKVAKGDVVRMVTATGGGWGDPARRSKTALREDLRNGFLTADQIDRHYGGIDG
jgi:N-methylhydantoinase B